MYVNIPCLWSSLLVMRVPFFFFLTERSMLVDPIASLIWLFWVAVASCCLFDSNILFLNNVGNMEEDLLLVVPYWGFSLQKRNDQLDLEMKLLPSAFDALTFCTAEDLPSSTRDLHFLHSSAHCSGCFPASGLPCSHAVVIAALHLKALTCARSHMIFQTLSPFPLFPLLFPPLLQSINIYCATRSVNDWLFFFFNRID